MEGSRVPGSNATRSGSGAMIGSMLVVQQARVTTLSWFEPCVWVFGVRMKLGVGLGIGFSFQLDMGLGVCRICILSRDTWDVLGQGLW